MKVNSFLPTCGTLFEWSALPHGGVDGFKGMFMRLLQVVSSGSNEGAWARTFVSLSEHQVVENSWTVWLLLVFSPQVHMKVRGPRAGFGTEKWYGLKMRRFVGTESGTNCWKMVNFVGQQLRDDP